MSRRRKLPHCFYCNTPTTGATSQIAQSTPVCASCSHTEEFHPKVAVERWISLGGDRSAALAFMQQLTTARMRQRPIGATA